MKAACLKVAVHAGVIYARQAGAHELIVQRRPRHQHQKPNHLHASSLPKQPYVGLRNLLVSIQSNSLPWHLQHELLATIRDLNKHQILGFMQLNLMQAAADRGPKERGQDLQDVEVFPASPKAEHPHKERPAGVNGAARRAAQLFGHADAEEVKEGYGYHAGRRCDLQLPRPRDFLRRQHTPWSSPRQERSTANGAVQNPLICRHFKQWEGAEE